VVDTTDGGRPRGAGVERFIGAVLVVRVSGPCT
jgi:hypothetical protein